MLKGYTKQEISWMMYDWANSAHSVIIVTLLPIFFDTVAGYTADSVSSMSTWGYATSIAMLIVALAAPFLGVFGDIRGMRKKLFSFFMLLGVAACAGMAFTPGMDFTSGPVAAGKVASLILILYIVSVIGFDASAIYYDAFLTDVTTEDRMDKVSTMGYGLGYIGGSTIPLLIFLIMNLVGVPMLTCLAFVFGLTAVWWLAFSLPLLKNCEQTSGKPYEKGDVARSIKGVGTTIKEIIAKAIDTYKNVCPFAEIVPVSALRNQNTDKMTELLFQYLPYGPQYYDEDTVTDQPMRQIAAELIREKALRLLQDEIPHGIAVTIEQMKERDNGIFDIEATIVCERDSHKGIIIGKGGAMLKRIGSQARREIENLMGAKVNLQLWVKVRKEWRDSELYMKNYGYFNE